MANNPGASPFPPQGTVKPFGDIGGTIDERLTATGFAVTNAQNQLDTALQRVGMTRSYQGEDSHGNLRVAIELYTRAVAHHEMLRILSTEDFFVAMARSAGAVKA